MTINMTRRICRIVAPLVASLALPIVTASVASASDTILPNGRAAQVSVADLDLSTSAGQTIAHERVLGMARTLCARISDSLDLDHHAHYLACVTTATDRAIEQILQPGLARAPKGVTTTASAAKASTENGNQARRARVSLDDLDLSTPEGVQAAHERLHQAARQVCSQVEDELDLSRQTNFVTCVDDAMASAQIDIQNVVAKQRNASNLLGSTR